jgi:hypothetical protein
VARAAEAEATVEAPALVGAARSRFTEAPTPAVPDSPRERAICDGCSDGCEPVCDASARAGLSTGVGEAAAAAIDALREGLADGAAAGLALGTAAVCALVGEGRAAESEGLADGAPSASGFCEIAGLLVACRATVEVVGRTSAAVDDAAGAVAGAGVAATSLKFGVAWTGFLWPACGEGVCATAGAVSAGRRRLAACEGEGDSAPVAGVDAGAPALAATAGDEVVCRATAALAGCGVALGADSAAPGALAFCACVAAKLVSCGAWRRTGCATAVADAVAAAGCVSRRATEAAAGCSAAAGEGASTGAGRSATESVARRWSGLVCGVTVGRAEGVGRGATLGVGGSAAIATSGRAGVGRRSWGLLAGDCAMVGALGASTWRR